MKKIFVFMALAVALLLPSCSNDDEPQNDGLSDYLNAVEMLYDNEAQPKFTASDVEGIYLAWAADGAEVEAYVRELTGNASWSITQNYTMNADRNGSLVVTGQTPQMAAEGIFADIVVKFADYPHFTLHIITEEKAKDYDNRLEEDGFSGGGVARLETPVN